MAAICIKLIIFGSNSYPRVKRWQEGHSEVMVRSVRLRYGGWEVSLRGLFEVAGVIMVKIKCVTQNVTQNGYDHQTIISVMVVSTATIAQDMRCLRKVGKLNKLAKFAPKFATKIIDKKG